MGFVERKKFVYFGVYENARHEKKTPFAYPPAYSPSSYATSLFLAFLYSV
jgi:hypothetical protein